MDKKKSCVFVILSIAIVLLCSCTKQNETLENKLSKYDQKGEVELSKLTDFKWDHVYFIAPYTEKAEIEKSVGITSNDIHDNMNDGTLYMIFTQGGKIVYQIYKNQDSLGFYFDVGEYKNVKQLSKNQCLFEVGTEEKDKIYTWKQS